MFRMTTSGSPRLLLALAGLAWGTTAFAADLLWHFEADGRIVGKPAIVGETLYVAGGRTLHAVDLEGRELWQRALPGDLAATVAVGEDVLFVHSTAGLHAVDREGQLLWTYEEEDRGPLVDGRTWGWGEEILADPWGWYRSSPLVTQEAVVFGSSDGVHAVSPATGEKLWTATLGPVTADPVAVEDLVVVACWNNSVYGLEQSSGKVRWRFRAPIVPTKGADWIGYAGFHLTPIVEGDRIYVGNRGTFFYALDAGDGTEVWSSKVGASWIGSPAVLTEDEVYYGLSDGVAVMGHDRKSGALRFFFEVGSEVFAQPEVSGEHLLVGTLSGRLWALDLENGGGELLHVFGPEVEKKYQAFFHPDVLPKGLSPHETTQVALERMLAESNSVLNLSVHGSVAYVVTATSGLHAVDLGSLD